ncbi:transposase, MuDR, MULE transposase domain protein [Tanacetum coccineum]
MDSNFNNENEPWELSLDIDDSDLQLTHIVSSSSSTHVEPSPLTQNSVTIIPGSYGFVQRAKRIKENVFFLDSDGEFNVDTKNYMQKSCLRMWVRCVYQWGAWGKLKQVVAIIKSCYPNALGNLNVALKDLSGTVPGTIHYKVLDVGSYGKDIIVGAAMILANVSVFTPKPSEHYLNITKRNVVEVFRKDTVSLV